MVAYGSRPRCEERGPSQWVRGQLPELSPGRHQEATTSPSDPTERPRSPRFSSTRSTSRRRRSARQGSPQPETSDSEAPGVGPAALSWEDMHALVNNRWSLTMNSASDCSFASPATSQNRAFVVI